MRQTRRQDLRGKPCPNMGGQGTIFVQAVCRWQDALQIFPIDLEVHLVSRVQECMRNDDAQHKLDD